MKRYAIVLARASIAALTLSASLLISANGLEVEDGFSVVRAVPPVYPPLARAADVSGEVIVETIIDVQGAVTSASASQGNKLLSMAAEKAASKWRFNALEGKEKERKVRLTFQFTLIPSNKGTPDDLGVIFWPPFKVEVRDSRYRVN